MLQGSLLAEQSVAALFARVLEQIAVLRSQMLLEGRVADEPGPTVGHRTVLGHVGGMYEQHVRAQIGNCAVCDQTGGAFEQKRGDLREAGVGFRRVYA